MDDEEIEVADVSSDPTNDEHLPVAGEIPEEDGQISNDDLDI
jgi:hypothetical protein